METNLPPQIQISLAGYASYFSEGQRLRGYVHNGKLMVENAKPKKDFAEFLEKWRGKFEIAEDSNDDRYNYLVKKYLSTRGDE